jgi:hypothetical protein
MGKGDGVNRILVTALAGACMIVLAASPIAAQGKDDKPPSMRFEWRVEGPAEVCGNHCRSWISATGVLTEDSVRAFEAFARTGSLQGATLVLDSEGGSVLSAMALGRHIRNHDMTTTVGRTVELSRLDGSQSRATLSPKATCESMCTFLLLAGSRRYVPAEARVLVHQIWLGAKSKRARDVTYSADELQLVQRDIGRLARYTIEMGGGIELIETALRVPPWEPMHRLSDDELRRMKITTVDYLFEPPPPAPPVASAGPNAITTAQGRR